jgi:alkanesulfonate monooxygenase SsuD/methylene tetrahydromethanopterin reductase-like flavin-dependent oxidoreductase (luciferase family)
MFNANALKLGLFAANCSSGTAVTKVPERWDASWESNLALAQMADKAGIEFMLPIARWKGYGGETDFQGATLETITWAGGLLAHTRNMTVFGTVHAPLLHPVIAAKQMATVDHIGRGRFGLNIVCGWNQDEFEMFGIEQREHDIRYDYGQEWWDVVRRLWTERGSFDFAGQFIKLEGLAAEPKPYGGRSPIVMNAGSSPPGQRFAARNCDMMFTALVDFDRAKAQLSAIRAMAAEYGRNVQVYTSSHVVCRPTEREAREYHQYYAVDNADAEGVERLMRLQGLHAQSYPPELIVKFRTRFAGGHGSYPIIGTPDQVAAELKRIHDCGFAGATIAMVNYLDSLPFIVQEVLPRLERLGLRRTAA